MAGVDGPGTAGGDALVLRLVDPAEVRAADLVPLINRAYQRYEILLAPRISEEGFAIEWKPAAAFLLASAGDQLVGCAMVAAARDYFEVTLGEAAVKPAPLFGSDFAEAHEDARPHGPLLDGDLADAAYFGLAAVEPAAQGLGCGRRLVQEAERWARDRGFRRIVLTTVRELGLCAYYERQGYRVAGEERFPAGHWSFSVPHGYCYMEKAL